MSKNKTVKGTKPVLSYILLTIGAVIFALSTYMFLLPAKLIPGGITGISSVIQNLFGFPSQYTILIANVPILIAAFFVLDKRFAVRTIIGILLVAGVMELFSRIDLYAFVQSSGEPFIPAIVSGVMGGIGIGLILNANASSGGTEALAMLIQKKRQSLKLSQILLIMNVAIMLVGAVMYVAVSKMNLSELIGLLVCSVIQSALSSKTVDYFLNGVNSAVKIEIVTKKGEAISAAITAKSKYGVTIVESKGAYSEEKSLILICIVHKTKVPQFKRLIKNVDADAFVFTSDTREILGSNFRSTR